MNASFLRLDEKTVRKWQWRAADALASLKVVRFCIFLFFNFRIRWNERKGGTSLLDAHITVDGPDFSIREPKHFSPQ